MTRILMVCLGNICRSPLAQGILKSKLPQNSFYIDSAGTAGYHVGSAPDQRSVQVAQMNGIDISAQKARTFSSNDFKDFDLIFAMDQNNYQDIMQMAHSEAEKDKVKLILKQNINITITDVPDPYYGTLSDFKKVFMLLDEACNTVAAKLLSNREVT